MGPFTVLMAIYLDVYLWCSCIWQTLLLILLRACSWWRDSPIPKVLFNKVFGRADPEKDVPSIPCTGLDAHIYYMYRQRVALPSWLNYAHRMGTTSERNDFTRDAARAPWQCMSGSVGLCPETHCLLFCDDMCTHCPEKSKSEKYENTSLFLVPSWQRKRESLGIRCPFAASSSGNANVAHTLRVAAHVERLPPEMAYNFLHTLDGFYVSIHLPYFSYCCEFAQTESAKRIYSRLYYRLVFCAKLILFIGR